MQEVIRDLLNRIRERENEFSSIKDRLLAEKLKTSILRYQLGEIDLTQIQLVEILKANIDFNNSL